MSQQQPTTTSTTGEAAAVAAAMSPPTNSDSDSAQQQRKLPAGDYNPEQQQQQEQSSTTTAAASAPGEVDNIAASATSVAANVETDVGGDISRIIQRERDEAAKAAAAAAVAISSKPDNPMPINVLASSASATTVAKSPMDTRTLSIDDRPADQLENQHQQVVRVKTTQHAPASLSSPSSMPQYEIIQPAAGVVNANMNELNQVSSSPDFMVQQKPSSQSSRNLPSFAANGINPIAAADVDSSTYKQQFGHLPETMEPVPQQVARPSPEKMPIYRSLFKSFKSGNSGASSIVGPLHKQNDVSRAIGATGRYQRNLVAVARRRRDRVQQHQQQVQALINAPPAEQRVLQTAPIQSEIIAGGPAPAARQVTPIGASPAQRSSTAPSGVAASSNAVGTYLQLLNHRYNLRFPRVSSAATQIQESVRVR